MITWADRTLGLFDLDRRFFLGRSPANFSRTGKLWGLNFFWGFFLNICFSDICSPSILIIVIHLGLIFRVKVEIVHSSPVLINSFCFVRAARRKLHLIHLGLKTITTSPMTEPKAVSAGEAGTKGWLWMVVSMANSAEGSSFVDVWGIVVKVSSSSLFRLLSDLLNIFDFFVILFEFLVKQLPFICFVFIVIRSDKQRIQIQVVFCILVMHIHKMLLSLELLLPKLAV